MKFQDAIQNLKNSFTELPFEEKKEFEKTFKNCIEFFEKVTKDNQEDMDYEQDLFVKPVDCQERALMNYDNSWKFLIANICDHATMQMWEKEELIEFIVHQFYHSFWDIREGISYEKFQKENWEDDNMLDSDIDCALDEFETEYNTLKFHLLYGAN